MEMPGFEAFGLRTEVLTALQSLGYEEPTPIQRETIPALINGRDVLGQAATGTGKTAAFALPILERISPADRRPFEAQALVLVPTRELAMQVAEAVQKYGAGIGVVAVPVYGGQEIFTQIRPLKRGADVVIATPGRALDHLRRKSLLLGAVKVVVLDEADEMLDMGFEEDLQTILNELPAERQTALFSATLAPRIAKIAEKHLKNPVRVTIAAKSVEAGTLPKIRQAAYVVKRGVKEAALMRVLEWEEPPSALVFCRTRKEVEELTHVLMKSGYEPAALHGGMTQEQRDGVLRKFKDGKLRVLVATDVAARGLHVENLSHVINFDLPTSAEVYVHRIGRTGRAGKEGVALSFVDPREQRLLGNVERLIKSKVLREDVPSKKQLDEKRAQTVAQKVREVAELPRASAFAELVEKVGLPAEQVAAAAMMLLQDKLYPSHDGDVAESLAAPEKRERSTRERSSPRREAPAHSGDMVALKLNVGEKAGVRPQDIVGAIANEADVPSSQIRGVRVNEFDSHVEVPADVFERVKTAIEQSRIRGRRVRVEQDNGRSAEGREGGARTFSDKPKRDFGDKREFSDKPKRDFGEKREFGDKPKRDFGEKRPFGDKPKRDFGDKPAFSDKPKRDFGEKREFGDKPKRDFGEKRTFSDKPKRDFGEKREFGDKPKRDFGEKRTFGDKPKRDFGEKRTFSDKPKRDFGSTPGAAVRSFNAPKPGDRFKARSGRMEPKKR